MELDRSKVLRTFSKRNIAIAVSIGLGVGLLLLYKDIQKSGLDKLNEFTRPSIPGILGIFITLNYCLDTKMSI